MTPPAFCSLNGTDLSVFDLWVGTPSGWADGPALTDRFTSVPGQAGGLLLTTEADIATRQITIPATLISTSFAGAVAQWNSLKALLASPVLELAFVAWPGVFATVRYQGMAWQGQDHWLGGWQLTMRFVAANPYLLSRQVDVYTLDVGQTFPLTLGTAPSPVDIRFIGKDLSTPSVVYTDANGVARGNVTFAPTPDGVLDTSEWIEFDGITKIARWHRLNGVVQNAMPILDPASRFFVADPTDGDGTVGPSLMVTGGAAVALVRKSWL